MAEYVYGKNVIKQLLKNPSQIEAIYYCGKDQDLLTQIKKANVKCEAKDKKALTKMVNDEHHQGFVAKIKEVQTVSLETLIENTKSKHGLIVLLDGLEDPHNLGAILRTCDATKVDGVIFKKNGAVGLTPTVAKVSAGAIDTVPCCEVTNLSRTVEELKEKGYWIVGGAMEGQDYRSLNYDFPTVIVIGNEGKGISRLVKEKCDYLVSIPMAGEIESLNASVSAAVLLYEVYNKRFPL